MALDSIEVAKRARLRTVQISHNSKTSHVGSSLSCIDILSVYYDGTTYFASLGKGFA